MHTGDTRIKQFFNTAHITRRGEHFENTRMFGIIFDQLQPHLARRNRIAQSSPGHDQPGQCIAFVRTLANKCLIICDSIFCIALCKRDPRGIECRLIAEQTLWFHVQNFCIMIFSVSGLPQSFGALSCPKGHIIGNFFVRGA